MPDLTWQKSTYSAEAANCVNVAAGLTDTIHLRESDEPGVVLTTTPARLRALIHGLKAWEGQVRDTTPQPSSRFSSRSLLRSYGSVVGPVGGAPVGSADAPAVEKWGCRKPS